MGRRGQLVLGGLFILGGLALLLGNLLDIPVWSLCWPILLISLGLWILLRPRLVGTDGDVVLLFIGDVKRDETWELVDQEIWAFIADVDLNLTAVEFPPGEINYRYTGFAGDVEVAVPADVGVAVHALAFVSAIKADGEKSENLAMPVRYESPNYATASSRVRLDTLSFVGEISVRQG